MKFKLITDSDEINFEKTLNDFISKPTVAVEDITFNTCGVPPDPTCGWSSYVMYSALISFRESPTSFNAFEIMNEELKKSKE